MGGMRKVIFVRSRNAAQSQMNEGFLRALYVLAAFPDVRDRIGSWIKGEFGPGGPLREMDSPGLPPLPDLQKT